MIHEVPVLVRIVIHTCGTVQLIIAQMNSALFLTKMQQLFYRKS